MVSFGSVGNPFDAVKGADGESLFEESLEKHHVIPQNIFSEGSSYTDLRDFLKLIGWDGDDLIGMVCFSRQLNVMRLF